MIYKILKKRIYNKTRYFKIIKINISRTEHYNNYIN